MAASGRETRCERILNELAGELRGSTRRTDSEAITIVETPEEFAIHYVRFRCVSEVTHGPEEP